MSRSPGNGHGRFLRRRRCNSPPLPDKTAIKIRYQKRTVLLGEDFDARANLATGLRRSVKFRALPSPGELIVAAISASFDNKAPMQVTCSRPLL
jgi:hypothetical protein